MKSVLNLEEAGFLVKPLYPTESSLKELESNLDRHIDGDVYQHYQYKVIVDDVEYESHAAYVEHIIGNYSLFPSFYLTASSKPNDFIRGSETDRTQTCITNDAELRDFIYRKPYIHEIQTSSQNTILSVIAMADAVISIKKLEVENLRDIKTESRTIYRVGL